MVTDLEVGEAMVNSLGATPKSAASAFSPCQGTLVISQYDFFLKFYSIALSTQFDITIFWVASICSTFELTKLKKVECLKPPCILSC